MKTLFRLKKIPWSNKIYMTNEMAEKAYRTGKDLKGNFTMSRRVPYGFYSKELTFVEWLNKYHVVILGGNYEV